MNASTLLNQIITEELNKIEQNGEKVKLKSIRKKRIIAALILGVIALIYSAAHIIFPIICLVIYIFIFVNSDKVKSIAKLAQKMPNTPIDEIIRGDMI